MTKHTPGPWHHNVGPQYPIYAGDAPRHVFIAVTCNGETGTTQDERRANMRLIASAPDLLSDLRDLLAALLAEEPEGFALSCAVGRARAFLETLRDI
jgi:hypothetical protein